MRISFCALLLMTTVAAPRLGAAPQCDPWKPGKDPANASENPPSTSDVYIGNIKFTYPEPYKDWFDHNHTPEYDGTFAFGDVLGVDDGEQHVVIAMPGEAVMAAEYSVNFQTKTGTLTPIWFWLSPYGRDASFDIDNHDRWKSFNILLYDFDADGKNEVVVNSAELAADGVTLEPVMFVLQTDERDPPPVSPFTYTVPDSANPPSVLTFTYPHPAPVELARTPSGLPFNETGERLGICKVTNEGWDIILHEHHFGSRAPIWKYTNLSGMQGQGQLNLLYKAEISPSANNTMGANDVKTHEFNYVDVDGDGYDEFFIDGLLDFVDKHPVTGEPVPTNGIFGKLLWTSGYTQSTGHFDQLLCADWDRDPADPEPLELLAITEGGGSVPFPAIVDLFLEPKTGAVIRENLGTVPPDTDPAPARDAQEAVAGNFTRTRDGLETLFVPKDFDNQIIAPGQESFSASYVIDAQQRELAVDGVNFSKTDFNVDHPSEPVIGRHSTGPATPRPMVIDWDGERSQDEVMATPWRTINVWSLNDKMDLPHPIPCDLPRESDLVSGTTILPFEIDGNDYTVWYYQGVLSQPHPEWAWNHGGPGRFTHYWQKLGEIFPFRQAYEAIPFDVALDHREEIVVMNASGLFFMYNPDSLGVDPIVSPSIHPAYRRHRMEENIFPFAFDVFPELTSLEVRPADPDLPSRVVGVRLRKKLPLVALAHFSDGTTVDVTKRVLWIDDPETSPHISFSSKADEVGVLVSKLKRTSARVKARLFLGVPGNFVESNFLYVQASNRDQPEILMAGYDGSFLEEGSAGTLRITAYLAQRDNHPMMAAVVTPDNRYWHPFGFGDPQAGDVTLRDDGQGGDVTAGDGIWSTELDPGPQDGDGISLGDNLLAINAAWPEDLLFLSPVFFSGGPKFHVSETWPYKNFGQQSLLPMPAPPEAIVDAEAFEAPRVLVSGMRGHGADSDELLIEARIGSFALSPTATVTVRAFLSWRNDYVMLAPRGNGVYSKLIDASDAPNGSYVIPVQATALFVQGAVSEWASDFGAYLYLHGALP